MMVDEDQQSAWDWKNLTWFPQHWGFPQISRIWEFWGRNINLPLLDCCFLSRSLGIELLFISNQWCSALSNTWPGSSCGGWRLRSCFSTAVPPCKVWGYTWPLALRLKTHQLLSIPAAWDQLVWLTLIPAYEGFDLCTCSFEQIVQMLIGSSWVVLRPVMHSFPGCFFYFQLFSAVQHFCGDCAFICVKCVEVLPSEVCCFIILFLPGNQKVQGKWHSFPLN